MQYYFWFAIGTSRQRPLRLSFRPNPYLLELNIPLSLNKRGIPRQVALILHQLGIELRMGGTIKLRAFDLAVLLPFIGIKEAGGPKLSEHASQRQAPILRTYTYRHPSAAYIMSARPIQYAAAALPIPRFCIRGIGRMARFKMLPV